MTPKRRKDKPLASWQTFASFPQPFSYEVDAPLNEVVQSLSELEHEARVFRRTTAQEVSILPAGNEYFFRVRHRRHGTITAMAEGHVWQDETGCTIVEGETRMNGWSMITPLVVVGIISFGFLLQFLGTPIPFTIPLALFLITMSMGSALSWRAFRRDHKQLADQLHDIMTSLQHQDNSALHKHSSRLSLEDRAEEQASMWSEDPATKQEKRR